MKKLCKSCGAVFEVAENENYKTLCKSCFIASKKNPLEQPAVNLKLKKICQSCEAVFEVAEDENYKTLCKSCFIESRKNQFEQLKGENENLKAEIKLLKERIKELESDLAFRNDKYSLGLFELLKLQNTALKHEIEELTKEKPLPIVK